MLSRKSDKNGAIWCILSVPKYDIINLKINNFLDYNKSTTTQILCHIFSKINPDAHVSTKNKYIHILQGVRGGQ